MRLHALAIAVGEHGHAAGAGREAKAGIRYRLDENRHREAGVQGFQPHPRRRVGGHFHSGRRAAAVALHADVRDERADRVQQPRFRAGGQKQAIGRNGGEHPFVLRREARHFAPPASGKRRPILVIVFAGVWFHAHLHAAVVLLVDGQLGFAAHHVQRVAVAVENMRMPGEREQARRAGVEILSAAPILARGQRRDGVAVLLEQEGHAGRLGGQALEGDAPAFAPIAVLQLALFADVQRHGLVAHLQIPGETSLRLGFGLAAGGLSLGVVGELFQRLQRRLPLRHWRDQTGQRGGAQLPVRRPGFVGGSLGSLGGGLARTGRCLGISLVAVPHGVAKQDFVAFGHHPLEAGRSRAWAQARHQIPAALRVGVEIVDPTTQEAVEQGLKLRLRRRPREDAALGFDAHRVGHQFQFVDEARAVHPFRGAQQLLQQFAGRRRVRAHQRQQGQRERVATHKHQALSGAGFLVRHGGLDVARGGFVVAPQRGDERLGGGQAGARLLAVATARRQCGEHALGVVEAALQDAQERDVGGVQGGRRTLRLAKRDQRLRLHRGVDRAVEATGERRPDVADRQRLDQVGAQGIGQHAPRHLLVLVEDVAQALEVRSDEAAAEPHLVLVVVVVVAPPLLSRALQALHDGVQIAFAVGNAGKRQGAAIGHGAAFPRILREQPGLGQFAAGAAGLVDGHEAAVDAPVGDAEQPLDAVDRQRLGRRDAVRLGDQARHRGERVVAV